MASDVATGTGGNPAPAAKSELLLKEDWWAVWIGLGIVIVGSLLYLSGQTLSWLAVTPAKWTTLAEAGSDLVAKVPRYLVLFVFWLVLFAGALRVMGHRFAAFVPAFVFIFVFSVAIFVLGQWAEATKWYFEPPLVALALGLIISNFGLLPRRFDSGFRVEFYIKVGIVLLGATLPFTLVIWAGPIAILQASIVSIATFGVIFWMARVFGLDRRFAATLGVGGAVCGVSAAIAVAGAVGAKKEDTSITISTVVIWAIVMVFVLPVLARAFGLPTGVAGAWIGTSEFADAAGFAAAQTYAGYAGKVAGITGTPDQAVWSFTLMKVVGRDVWIGIWCFVLAIIATSRWDRADGIVSKADAGEIWRRFPKFVIGFIVASVLVSLVTSGLSYADFNKQATPTLITPIKDLRSWAFIFCFFSIGLTTRFRELASAGAKPFIAFSIGVAANVVLGYVLSAIVFASYWEKLVR